MKKGTSSVAVAGTPNGNRPAGPSAEQLTEQNVETVTSLEEAAREHRTPTDRLAAKIASFCGSMTFVWVHAIAAKVGADLTQDSHLKALSEETQPERLIEQIEARENN